jgi:hypothetical protein
MYTEEDEFYVEYQFDLELNRLNKRVADDIMLQVAKSVRTLPIRDGKTQLLGGVCLIGEPTYFMVEYMNESDYYPMLLRLTITDVDTYLDLMNLSKTIKNEPKRIKARNRPTTKRYNKG